jgi:hypothetical protein
MTNLKVQLEYCMTRSKSPSTGTRRSAEAGEHAALRISAECAHRAEAEGSVGWMKRATAALVAEEREQVSVSLLVCVHHPTLY